MRRLAIAALTAALVVVASAPARACDPYWEWCGDEWYDPYWDLPAYEEPSAGWWWDEPVYDPAPTWSDPIVWSAPGSDVLDAWAAPAPPPVPVAADPDAAATALGLHRVTEVWTGHTTATEGPLTTYSSTSAAQDAGTAARLIASVGTGQSTAYDPIVLGGRTTLSDGRAVSGEIYENYVWNGYEWVVNGYVFFQDDSELARVTQIPTPTPTPVAHVTVPTSAPVVTGPVPPAPVTTAPSAPASVTPVPDGVPGAPIPTSPPAATAPPAPRVVRAGIALAPQADPLDRIEVLRGRAVPLWVRATVDGVPARIVRWELRSGEVEAVGPVSGSGDEPLVATWRTMSAPGVPFAVRLRASVEVPAETLREVDASIDVVVRAPALVE